MEKKMSILVVDDEPIVCDSCKKILTEKGFTVETALNGEEALKTFKKGDFDIVIVDLKMPGIDGMEVLRSVKKSKPEVDVLMITGYGTIPSAVEAMKIGAADYVPKPFTPKELGQIISQVVEKRSKLVAEKAPKKGAILLDVFKKPPKVVYHPERVWVKDIKIEEALDENFLNQVRSTPGGERVMDCMQCGTCSGSCPLSYRMDYTPREINAMVRAGLRDEVLSSNSIWMCSSCYLCTVRCPRQIKITDIMYVLKNLAMKDKRFLKKAKSPLLSRYFVDIVNRYGRNHELELTLRFFLRTNPKAILKHSFMGLRLFLRKRFTLFPKRIKNINQLRTMVRKAEALGGLR
ncbi:MAG: response regulator [Candidatus Aminicenantes bacterium]|nr:response regulator [Candidatus Aminicenantes bacterium]